MAERLVGQMVDSLEKLLVVMWGMMKVIVMVGNSVVRMGAMKVELKELLRAALTELAET